MVVVANYFHVHWCDLIFKQRAKPSKITTRIPFNAKIMCSLIILTCQCLFQVSITDVLKLSYDPGPLDLGSGLPFSGSGKSSSSNPDWATKVKEWQTAEQLTRMRDEEPILKNGGDRKFNELCVVCGDKASGMYMKLTSCNVYD